MNGPARRRYALVVEDDPGVRMLFHATLELDGWDVHTAIDGAQALERMHRRAPDLVVLDMMMPGVGGMEVLQAMLEHPELRRVPRIVCTARESQAEATVGRDLGATEWLVKPVSPEALVAIANRLVPSAPATA